MRSIIIILFVLWTNSILKCQVSYAITNKYYDNFYYHGEGGCFAFDEAAESTLIDSFLLEDEYLHLEVLNIYSNLAVFAEDEDGYFLPYDTEEFTLYEDLVGDEISAYDLNEYHFDIKDIPQRFIDTIQIIRRKSSEMLIEKRRPIKKNEELYVEAPLDFIQVLVLNAKGRSHKKYKGHSVSIEIEFRDGDIISKNLKREVLCPGLIDAYLINELNHRLVSLEYLPKKRRLSFGPEIKNAVFSFQKESGIPVGFIDRKTLKLLGLDWDEF